MLDVARSTSGADLAYSAGITGASVTVALIDTGIDDQHPGFTGRIASSSMNFTSAGAPNNLNDNNGHGTHIAGIVGGDGSGSKGSFRGVAPDVSLMVLKALSGTGRGWSSKLTLAIDHAVKNGAQVINLSVGESPWNPPSRAPNPPWAWPTTRGLLEDCCTAAMVAGVLVVVAAGNDGNLQSKDATINRPGIVDAVLTVGSVDRKGTSITNCSSRGPVYRTSAIGPGLSASLNSLGPSDPVIKSAKPDLIAPGGESVAGLLGGACPHTDGSKCARQLGRKRLEAVC